MRIMQTMQATRYKCSSMLAWKGSEHAIAETGTPHSLPRTACRVPHLGKLPECGQQNHLSDQQGGFCADRMHTTARGLQLVGTDSPGSPHGCHGTLIEPSPAGIWFQHGHEADPGACAASTLSIWMNATVR